MKKKLTSLLGILLCSVLGGGAIYLYLYLNGGRYEQLNLKYGADMNAVFAFMSPFAGLLAGYLLIRAGRLIAGLISGYRLIECSILGLGLHRKADGRLRLGFRRPVRRLCAILQPPAYDGSSPYRLHIAGSVLACGIVGVGVLIASLLITSVPEMLLAGVAGIILTGIALILLLHPARGVLVTTRRLAGNVHLRRAQEHHLFVFAYNRQNLTLHDLPADFFLPYPEELWGDFYVFVAQHNLASRMLTDGQYAQAHETLLKLIAIMEQPTFQLPRKEIQKLYFTCTCAIAEMMSGAPAVYANRINEPNIELFLGSGGWGTELLLAQYIRALLVTHDAPSAQMLQNRLINAPSPMSMGQRRIFEDAQRIAAERAAQEAAHE